VAKKPSDRPLRVKSPSKDLLRVYEGPEVLSALLSQAGCPLSSGEVAARFATAQARGLDRAEVVPGLFETEPRFTAPDAARRLYGNLFGLWDRIAQGLGASDDAPAASPAVPPAASLGERGLEGGDRLSPQLVEAVWRHLDALPDREKRRRRDRYTHAQPDLVAWLDDVPLPSSGAAAAQDLIFEAWAMFDQAFGDRLKPAPFKELKAVEAEPPPLLTEQPAFAAYAGEQLDVLEDEDRDFTPEARAQVERAVSAAVAALTRALAAE
jgi:hypothetical protein